MQSCRSCGRDVRGVRDRAWIQCRVVEADYDRAHELVDVRRPGRALPHHAEQQRVDGPRVQARFPGIVRARKVVVGIAVAELEIEALRTPFAVDQRNQRLHERLVDLVAAVDRQQVAARAAEAARRCELQAFVRDQLCGLVAMPTPKLKATGLRARELKRLERARHEAEPISCW